MTSSGVTETEGTRPAPEPQHAAKGHVVSIGEALNGTNNSLGLIRLILASVVIIDHAFPLGGWGKDPFWQLTNGQASLGSLAVAGFFAISGYLIAKSGMSGDVIQFMWRRTLRIFPAYWLLLLVTAFIVGPLLWLAEGEAIREYFTTGPMGPFYFITANWTLNIGTYGIHDLLAETTPYGREIGYGALNGSIWTLIYEWNCYLIIAVLVAFGVLRRARPVVPLLTGFFFVMLIVAGSNWTAVGLIMPKLADPHMITLGFTFLLGSTLAVYSKEVPFDNRLGILSGLVLIFSLRYGGFSTLGTIAGVYFVMYLAARLPRQTHWIGRKNDYSYGIYIYGFMVQQVGAYLGWHEWGFVPYVLVSWAVSLALAWVSWHLVEKRAMHLKNWGPGRGWQFWFDRARSKLTAKTNRNAS